MAFSFGLRSPPFSGRRCLPQRCHRSSSSRARRAEGASGRQASKLSNFRVVQCCASEGLCSTSGDMLTVLGWRLVTLMPACRQISLTGTPASACLRIETIWVLVERDFFMEPPSWGNMPGEAYARPRLPRMRRRRALLACGPADAEEDGIDRPHGRPVSSADVVAVRSSAKHLA